jgi:hydroxymethylbilane synthase
METHPPTPTRVPRGGHRRDRALRLGTRRGLLAVTQSQWVGRQVSGLDTRPVELVEIPTLGDTSSAAISSPSTGVFVTPLREALLRGEADMIVHSLKDLPAAPQPGLRLAAIPVREDPRDALVHPGGRRLLDLPPGTRIGTGSARRMVELRRLGLPVTVVPIRGSIDVRLRKLADGEVDALILAAAGLSRIGRAELITERIDPALVLPAPAQGALAVECRGDDDELIALLAQIDDTRTRTAVETERAFLAALGAGCTAPVGALARIVAPEVLSLEALAALTDDGDAIRVSGQSGPREGKLLGRGLAAVVLRARMAGAGSRCRRPGSRAASSPAFGR